MWPLVESCLTPRYRRSVMVLIPSLWLLEILAVHLWPVSHLTSRFFISVTLLIVHFTWSVLSAISIHPTETFFFCSITLAELDCWNSLLLGCSDFLIHKLQKVDNSVAYLTLRAITLLHFYFVLFFGSPHGEYKLSLLCFPFFSGSSSSCFSELLTSYSQTAPLLVWWLHFDLSVFLEWILLANTHLHVVHLKPGTPVPIRLVQSLKVFKNFLTL